MANSPIRVAELFAGVGGFRLGLEGDDFEFVFSNQWEPGEKAQWATQIYEERFGSEGHTGNSIHDFTHPKDGVAAIPDHDLLVGGFPCQDYSVARTISGELGIKGEKGKLWVDIARIIRHKRPRPKVVLLENVPRLLNSPANARGLNFAIILNDLIRMGYNVEWRVINAADYGMPQQRSRVFILAYRGSWCGQNFAVNGSERYGALKRSKGPMSKWMFGESVGKSSPDWEIGPFAQAFPATGELTKPELVPEDLDSFSSKSSPFGNAGYAYLIGNGSEKGPYQKMFWTTKVKADYDGERQTLGDVLVDQHDPSYEIECEDELYEWAYAKSEKKEFRIRKEDRERAEAVEVPEWERNLWEIYRMCLEDPDSGGWDEYRDLFTEHLGDICYKYEEGQIAYPDLLDRPSRTVVTSEIGRSPSRMRHLICMDDGIWRRLMPIELERLNMFPDDWTLIDGISDSRRGFLMGNALVVGVIERLRGPLSRILQRYD